MTVLEPEYPGFAAAGCKYENSCIHGRSHDVEVVPQAMSHVIHELEDVLSLESQSPDPKNR